MENRVLVAQRQSDELEKLIEDYLPFIKKQLAPLGNLGLEYDDMLALAMLTFVNCVRQYVPCKGSFLNFVAVSIKNRLIDESRKIKKYRANIIELKTPTNGNALAEGGLVLVDNLGVQAYNQKQERLALQEEIELFSLRLATFGINFKDLAKICPKQKRSRNLCFGLAKVLVENKEMKASLFSQGKVAQGQLASLFGINPKTIEKHRKYIVALAILLTEDYPSIKGFLPKYKEVK